MYNLPEPQNKYDSQFIQKFMQENKNPATVIKEWINDPNWHKHDDKVMYSVASLKIPYSQMVAMMCRLFGSVNTNKFKENWTPLIEETSDGYILN